VCLPAWLFSDEGGEADAKGTPGSYLLAGSGFALLAGDGAAATVSHIVSSLPSRNMPV